MEKKKKKCDQLFQKLWLLTDLKSDMIWFTLHKLWSPADVIMKLEYILIELSFPVHSKAFRSSDQMGKPATLPTVQRQWKCQPNTCPIAIRCKLLKFLSFLPNHHRIGPCPSVQGQGSTPAFLFQQGLKGSTVHTSPMLKTTTFLCRCKIWTTSSCSTSTNILAINKISYATQMTGSSLQPCTKNPASNPTQPHI